MTRGGRGVVKPPKHAYVIHGCSLNKARILRNKLLEKTFLEFKKWVKYI
jgi:hypothetical protein